jgi:general secretion pathway protein D
MPQGGFANVGVGLSFGALVGQARELFAFVQAQESTSKARVISAPSVIATDSIAASITVGSEVPTLASQAVTGAQQGGNSLFANTIANRNTGTTLNVLARVNPSGVVTLVINQEVSAAVSPQSGGIQSPSFDKKSVQTQVTLQDGDTIAIAGIINEGTRTDNAGVPGLSRIPLIGWAFGNKTYGRSRSELIIFMTPRVILDSTEIVEATDELRSRLKHLRKYVKE